MSMDSVESPQLQHGSRLSDTITACILYPALAIVSSSFSIMLPSIYVGFHVPWLSTIMMNMLGRNDWSGIP